MRLNDCYMGKPVEIASVRRDCGFVSVFGSFL